MDFVLRGLLPLFALFELALSGFNNTRSIACKQFHEIEMTCKFHFPVKLMCFNHSTKPSKPKARSKGYRKIHYGKETSLVKLYKTNQSWEVSFKTCIDDGGSLIKIDTPRKHRAIETIPGLNGGAWIGLRDTHDNDTYFWTDGSSLDYTNWYAWEPSHKNKEDDKENCARLKKFGPAAYRWRDSPCADWHYFLCEL